LTFCANNAHVVLRCTIIPGINDTDLHFRAIADLSKKYDAIKQVHVLPYHRYGESKYKHIGMVAPVIGTDSVNNELVNSWINSIRKLGGRDVVKG
jgi:pyruvate-formate lyase-activating enzyme